MCLLKLDLLVPTKKEIEFGFLVVEGKKKKGKLLCLENAQMTVSSSMAGKQNISQYSKQKKHGGDLEAATVDDRTFLMVGAPGALGKED